MFARYLALAGALACLGLGACGGDDEDQPARPPQEPAADSRIGSPLIASNDPALDLPDKQPGGPPSVATGAPPVKELDELPPPVGVGARRAACSGGTAALAASNGRQIDRALLCLVNAERTSRGLRALRTNRLLRRAALAHSRDMVRRRYFAHDSPSGADVVDRVRRTGFIPRSGSWAIGENLAFGTGPLGTPASIVRSWMGSPGHRANILQKRFREIGIGTVRGVPVAGAGGGATYTNVFGARG